MSKEKQKEQTMSLQVTEGLTVTILPDSNHEFLMPSKEVAYGYSISQSALRSHKNRQKSELIEGKHFVSGVANCNAGNLKRENTYWTKRGIVRLGFFIKSERARLFRDWAEDLVINTVEQTNTLPAYDVLKDFKSYVKPVAIEGRVFYHLQETLRFIRSGTMTSVIIRIGGIESIKLHYPGLLNEAYFIELQSLLWLLNNYAKKRNRIAAELFKALINEVKHNIQSKPSFIGYSTLFAKTTKKTQI